MKLLRVNMTDLRASAEPVPEKYVRCGGRGLIGQVLLEEVPATCDALGPHNKLIFAPGLLAGGSVSTAGRLSVGAKSPLTRGAKEANVGGTVGDMLGKLEIKAVIVEGQPPAGAWHLLHISGDAAELLPANHLLGLGTYATTDRLREQFGPDCSITCIGQAGEGLMTGAGIATTGEAGQRSNHAARGGLGSVMGSKGLKAIVVDKPTGKNIALADPDLFRTAARTFAQKLINDPKLGTKGSQHLYGTASIVGAVNEMGSLPVRNFSTGTLDASAQLRGEVLREVTLARGGDVGTRCMAGCVIACRNVYVDEGGGPVVGTLQYETIALLGSNLGLSDLDQVARLNYMCNDFGLDSIETGAALGVALEAGLADFGDFQAICGLLEQVGKGTVLGRLIGCGAVATGRVLGIRRVPVALGQAMPGYDPRSLKGNGVDLRHLAPGRGPHRGQCLRRSQGGQPARRAGSEGAFAPAADYRRHARQHRLVPVRSPAHHRRSAADGRHDQRPLRLGLDERRLRPRQPRRPARRVGVQPPRRPHGRRLSPARVHARGAVGPAQRYLRRP